MMSIAREGYTKLPPGIETVPSEVRAEHRCPPATWTGLAMGWWAEGDSAYVMAGEAGDNDRGGARASGIDVRRRVCCALGQLLPRASTLSTNTLLT
jgi:hypothetical protein